MADFGWYLWDEEHHPMPEISQVQRIQKDVKVWSSRKESQVALRVYFDMTDADGCTLYTIRQIDQMD